MAEALARRWSLGVLRVELDVERAVPEVVCGLQVSRGDKRVTVRERRVELRDFGAFDLEGRSRVRELEVGLPQDLIEDVATWVGEAQQQPRVGEAQQQHPILWVWLVKPYGPLGAVPWEQLWPTAGIPVLRLPDVLPDSRPPTSTIDVAICASGPRVKGPSPVAQTVPQVMRSVSVIGHPVRFHVFADSGSHGMLIGEIDHLGIDVEVYDWNEDMATPPARSSREARRRPEPMNPWLSWMAQSVRKRSFDFVQFVSHGYLLGDEGTLALSRDPDDIDAVTHIGAAQLLDFLPKVGAYGVVFTSTEQNYSLSGLRILADSIGSRRAGPVMLHDVASRDPDEVSHEVSHGYRLMLGKEAVADAPEAGSLMMYVQPEVVLTHKEEKDAREGEYGISFAVPDEGESLDFTPPEDVEQFKRSAMGEDSPAWASAMSRFIEQKQAELRTYVSEAGATSDQPYVRGMTDAIDELTEIAKQHLDAS
jgi:hypothetical protein